MSIAAPALDEERTDIMTKGELEAKLLQIHAAIKYGTAPLPFTIDSCQDLLRRTYRQSTPAIFAILDELKIPKSVFEEIRQLSDEIEAYALHRGDLTEEDAKPAAIVREPDVPVHVSATPDSLPGLVTEHVTQVLLRRLLASGTQCATDLDIVAGSNAKRRRALEPLVNAGVVREEKDGRVKNFDIDPKFATQLRELLVSGNGHLPSAEAVAPVSAGSTPTAAPSGDGASALSTSEAAHVPVGTSAENAPDQSNGQPDKARRGPSAGLKLLSQTEALPVAELNVATVTTATLTQFLKNEHKYKFLMELADGAERQVGIARDPIFKELVAMGLVYTWIDGGQQMCAMTPTGLQKVRRFLACFEPPQKDPQEPTPDPKPVFDAAKIDKRVFALMLTQLSDPNRRRTLEALADATAPMPSKDLPGAVGLGADVVSGYLTHWFLGNVVHHTGQQGNRMLEIDPEWRRMILEFRTLSASEQAQVGEPATPTA